MTSLSTHEIRSAEALAALEPEWWDLWWRCSVATPFQSPSWLLSWWNAFAGGQLSAVAVRANGRLVGLAPFYVDFGPLGQRLLPLGMSVSDYLDILADDDYADTVPGVLVRSIAELSMPWDSWELTELGVTAIGLGVRPPEGCTEESDAVSVCPVLALPRRLADLHTVIPPRKRRDLRAARHRAERRGTVDIVASTTANADVALARLIDLHRARWQSRGGNGVLADPRVQRFHADAVPGLMRAGIARFYTLEIAGRVAGVYYGFTHLGRAYGYLTGFDPAFEYDSPGTILIGHAIEEAVHEEAREFHFLRGSEKYKYQWGARDRWNRRRVFRRALTRARAS